MNMETLNIVDPTDPMEDFEQTTHRIVADSESHAIEVIERMYDHTSFNVLVIPEKARDADEGIFTDEAVWECDVYRHED